MNTSTRSISSLCSKLRLLSRPFQRQPYALSCMCTLPPPSSGPTEYSENIVNIVQSISKLTLLEVSHLNTLLKQELNIQDAPMMPMTGMVAPAAAVEEEAAVEEQTEFSVKLLKFDDKTKVKLIKEIKVVLPDMNLVMAKKFVEGAPQMVKEKLTKEEADKMKAQLEAVGGVVEIQ